MILKDIKAKDIKTAEEIDTGFCNGCIFQKLRTKALCSVDTEVMDIVSEVYKNEQKHCGTDPVIYVHKYFNHS